MLAAMAGRLLYVVAGAAPPAQDLHLVTARMRSRGWTLCIIPTPSALAFVDVAALRDETPFLIRSEYRRPDQERLPPPDAMLIAPMAYNTANKWAAGIADTFALGLLAEFVGDGSTSVVAVPWVKEALARNPVFQRSLTDLRTSGVTVLTEPAPSPLHAAQRVPEFPWDAALDRLRG